MRFVCIDTPMQQGCEEFVRGACTDAPLQQARDELYNSTAQYSTAHPKPPRNTHLPHCQKQQLQFQVMYTPLSCPVLSC